MKHPFGAVGIAAAIASLTLTGCLATAPTQGDASAKTAGTGSAGGANAENANTQLEKCDRSLGTLAIVENQGDPWFFRLREHQLGSTVPVLRLIIQQSNCFVIVERGAAMQNMQTERALMQSGELRGNSSFGKGQMVAADYTMSPSITFAEQGTGGLGAIAGGLLGSVAGAVAGSMKSNEASTILTMIDNRSGVQLVAAEGSAKNWDFGVMGGLFGGSGGAALGGYSKTPQGKVIVAAFMDSYNNIVKAVRNYKAQTVKGGLGTGGALGVDGGITPPAAESSNSGATKPASSTTKSTTRKATTKKSTNSGTTTTK